MLGPDGQPQYGFYEITLPGATVPFGPGGGRAFGDWYQPLHQNGNALSYPALDAQHRPVPLDPSVLGPPVTLAGSDAAGRPVTLPQPLLNKGYLVDATGSSVELSIAQTTGSGDTTNTTGTLSESADVDAGVYGTVNFGRRPRSAAAPTSTSSSTTPTAGARSAPPAPAPPPPTPSPCSRTPPPSPTGPTARPRPTTPTPPGSTAPPTPWTCWPAPRPPRSGSSTTAGAPTRPSTSPTGW